MRKSRKIRYLTPEEVVALHEFIMAFTHGESPQEEGGVKSTHNLLSACLECQQSFDGNDLYPELWDKAAALMRSLIQNHPFHNGNKRTGVICVDIFLQLNYFELAVPPNKLEDMAVKIASSKITRNKITRTLRKYSVHNPNSPADAQMFLDLFVKRKSGGQ